MDSFKNSGNPMGPSSANQLPAIVGMVGPIGAGVIIVVCLVFVLCKLCIDNKDDLENTSTWENWGNSFSMQSMSRYLPNNSSRFSFKDTEIHSV